MGIGAIILLINGIFFIILGILAINHYRLHPEKEVTLIYILFPFILGIIFITGAIMGYSWFIALSLIIISFISPIHSKYTSIKHPEIKKQREESREVYKKTSIYKFMRISRYILLVWGIFLGIFILIVVLFNITF